MVGVFVIFVSTFTMSVSKLKNTACNRGGAIYVHVLTVAINDSHLKKTILWKKEEPLIWVI